MSNNFQKWVEAKKKYRLSDVQVQIARELGKNPKKFGSLANHKQEKWKAREGLGGRVYILHKMERSTLNCLTTQINDNQVFTK